MSQRSTDEDVEDPDAWVNHAKCRGLPPGLFIPDDRGGPSMDMVTAICWGRYDGTECPVRQECFEAGEARNEFGVWGGFFRSSRHVQMSEKRRQEAVEVHIMSKIQDARPTRTKP